MQTKIESFGITHIGLSRQNNEDVWKEMPTNQFYIIADGMGGHNAGEVAASMAVDSMCTTLSAIPSGISTEDACQFLRDAISKANVTVYTEAHQNPTCSGMGTTLSCFLMQKDHLIYLHVGDSRLYRMRDKLQRLTEDHSLRNANWYKDDINAPTIPAPPTVKNAITRAIGTQPAILPDLGIIPLHSNDLYFLCSDGLSDCLPEGVMESIISASSNLEETAHALVDAALRRGGGDNITVLLVRVS